MSRAFRAFMVIYAGAMTALTVGSSFESPLGSFYSDWWGLWVFIAAVSLSYVVLALGYFNWEDREKTPTRRWLAIVFGLAASLPILVLSKSFGETTLMRFVINTVAVLGYLAVSAFMLSEFRLGNDESSRVGRIPVTAALIGGIGLVISSLFLQTTADHGTGWNIVTRRVDWITTGVNVGQGVLLGPTIEWLQPIYAPGGYAIYLLALIATLAMLAWLVVFRLSALRIQSSRIFPGFTAIFSLASLWVYTDVFWGWHFDFADIPWAAVLATVLWLAASLFGIVLLAPIVRGELQIWRLRAVLIFQLPVAAFNFLMLVYLFHERPQYARARNADHRAATGNLGMYGSAGLAATAVRCRETEIHNERNGGSVTRRIANRLFRTLGRLSTRTGGWAATEARRRPPGYVLSCLFAWVVRSATKQIRTTMHQRNTAEAIHSPVT